jgi:hypothetical protein
LWNWISLEKMGIELLTDTPRSYAFLPDDGPKFITGYSICIAFTILSIIASIIYGFACWNDNRRRDARTGEDHGLTEDEKAEMGDHSPEYRYLL